MTRDRFTPLAITFACILLIGAVALRWNGLDQPHWGIDEGVTFTIGQQISEGDVLYRDAVDHRTPLVPYLKALVFLVAGDWNIFAVRLMVALMLGLGALFVWRLARQLGNEPAGVVGAVLHLVATYVYLGIPDGPAASTAWFLIFFSTGGFWAFANAITRPSFKRGLGVGLWFGLAALCKQPALLDFGVTWVLIALALWRQPDDRRELARLFGGQMLGAMVPISGFALFFAAKGVWPDFVYYAFTYNTQIYVPVIPEADRWQAMQTPFLLAWEQMRGIGVIAVGGGASLLILILADSVRGFRSKRHPRPADTPPGGWPVLPWLILGWSAAGIVSTGLSGREFAHYSAQIIPGLALAGGWLLGGFYRRARKTDAMRWVWGGGGLVIAAIVGVVSVRNVITTHRHVSTSQSGDLGVGRLIAQHTAPTERIFVWGYFPEYHLMAKRLPATRFVYSNFLTRFVPWENMDSMVDTSGLVAQGAWEAMRTDFAAHPPALIVERESDRAQAKYPLNKHPDIWNEIIRHYAEVSFNAARGAVRFYRRYDAVPEPLVETFPPAPDSSLQLSAEATYRPGQTTSLTLTAPPGWNHFSLWIDGICARSLPHSAADPVKVHFFDPQGSLRRANEVRVVGRRADGSIGASAAMSFATSAMGAEKALIPGPPLTLGGVLTYPSVFEQAEDTAPPWDTEPGSVQLHAPGRLVYACSELVRRVDFVHGLRSDVVEQSDGYDVVMRWLPDDGSIPVDLWQTRVLVREEGRFRMTQHESVELPPRAPGRLEFEFLTGKRSDPSWDILFFGDDAESVIRPVITIAGAPFLHAHDNRHGSTSRWSRNPVGGWMVHAPGAISWPLSDPHRITAIEVDFGIEDGAFSPDGGRTDGVTFSVELQTNAAAEPLLLFSRHLDPLRNPADRGRQTSRVSLPRETTGTLTIRTGEGPDGNGAWDWAWIDDPRGVTAGPPITLPFGARPIQSIRHEGPVQSRDAQGPPDRWSAHSPSHLIYPKPVGLQKVRFGFGLEETVPHDEHGRIKSDGIVVVVNWIPDQGGEVNRLHHRHLDPSVRDEDHGPQHGEIELPTDESGLLEFRIEPGPNQNTAFDWAYWGTFIGNPTP